MSDRAPVFTLNDALVQAVARLVDDAGATREPSHSDLETVFRRAGVAFGDPHLDPLVRVGKQKRVRQTLTWALDNEPSAGTTAVVGLLSMLRGCGGFRPGSENYCGQDPIATCIEAFEAEGIELTVDGVLRPRSLAALSGRELTNALRSYVTRAQAGYEDSVLLAGTDKDLIEATATHVLTQRFGDYSDQANFVTLLGQAFVAVNLATDERPNASGLDGARAAMDAALFRLGCAVNRLRNKAGSGHGRPFIPDLNSADVRAATEAAGLVAGRLLDALGPL